MKNLVHVLGRNLGMGWDYNTNGTNILPRYTQHGEQCTGRYGFMEYSGLARDFKHPNDTLKWSPCSVEDFETYYNNVQPFCLREGIESWTLGQPNNPQ